MRIGRISMPVVIVLTLAFQCLAEEQPTRSEELQVLDHYLGEWSGKMQIPPTQDNPKGLLVDGTVKARWMLNDQWVQQEVVFGPAGGYPGMSVCTMMTYDKVAKKYSFFSFQQDGGVSRSTATWDEPSKTMTSVLQGDPNGPVVTVKADFSQAGTERWTMTIRNAEGNVVGQLVGVNQKK